MRIGNKAFCQELGNVMNLQVVDIDKNHLFLRTTAKISWEIF